MKDKKCLALEKVTNTRNLYRNYITLKHNLPSHINPFPLYPILQAQ